MSFDTSRWVFFCRFKFVSGILRGKIPPRKANRSPPQHSTDAVEDESERIFSKLVQSIEKHRADVKELLRFQEKAVIGHAEEMLENIQREMSELRRTNGELERLCHTEDHLLFLQVGQ